MEQPQTVAHPHLPTGRQVAPKSVFLALAFVIFCLLLFFFSSLGFVPYYVDGTPSAADRAAAARAMEATDVQVLTQLSDLAPDTLLLDSHGRLISSASPSGAHDAQTVVPTRIAIPAIDLDLVVQNPATTDVSALDALLVNGPARYANSATLGEQGNVIIFAHSSHLPVVHNQMYKAFNRVPDLKAGDTITLTGADGIEYLYSVNSVTKADVNDDVELSLAKTATKLTLVTCDTLTGKSARFVLDASFIGTVDPKNI